MAEHRFRKAGVVGSTPILGFLTIRPALPGDADGILEIYAPIVRDTAISFELEPPSRDEIVRRISAAHAWLVAEGAGRVLAYAYAGPFRPREAYRFSVEVTVYVRPDAHRRGIARALYDELFARLREKGFRQAIAAIALPNPASVALHERLGFRPVGVFRDVGFKFERWHDVGWWQRGLASAEGP